MNATEHISQYLCITVGGHNFAIPVSKTIEIVRPEDGTLRDRAASGDYRHSYQDRQLICVDLSAVLLKNPPRGSADWRLVIAEHDGKRAALLIDSADRIIRVGQEEIASPVEAPEAIHADFVESMLTTESDRIFVISIEKVFDAVKAKS
ncbi:MAG: chemotaxis protein CheW [Candidatus Zixiibacteriota bacterium]|nr:MAG: chemotaxis protein CheW [candidate division Zixibacteria bacterium]